MTIKTENDLGLTSFPFLHTIFPPVGLTFFHTIVPWKFQIFPFFSLFINYFTEKWKEWDWNNV